MRPAQLLGLGSLSVLAAAGSLLRSAPPPSTLDTDAGPRVSVPSGYLAGEGDDISSRAAEAERIFRQGVDATENGTQEIHGEGKNESGYARAHAVPDHRWTHVGTQPHAPSNRSNASSKPEPRLFFLFLTYEGLVHRELWQEFFSSVGASTDRWSALMHCKHQSRCESQLALQNPLGLQLVANVSSEYCVDLVSPMVRLLSTALASSSSPEDKFIFLSESTLPVKPFGLIYTGLTGNDDSDICVSPRKDWVKLAPHRGILRPTLLIKHSQWVILSVAHAKSAVRSWPQVKDASPGNWTISVWPKRVDSESGAPDFGRMPKDALPESKTICTDEWAVFASLFGVVSTRELQVDVPGMSSPRLFLDSDKFLTETQGICRTFETWGDPLGADGSLVAWQLSPMLSCYPHCERSGHPAHFLAATDRGLSVLRNSSFLFARKIPANLVNVDQFSRIILGEPFPWASLH